MTIKTIWRQTHRVMAFIAKPLTTRVTLLALAQQYLAPDSIAHNFLSYASQQLPMMTSHVDRLFDTTLMFGIGFLKKLPGRFDVVGNNTGNNRVPKRHQ
jgi:hypothetical protein